MGRLMISSSQMCISREQEEFLAAYRTDEARQAFIDSYGKEKVNFFDGGYFGNTYSDGYPNVLEPYDFVVDYLEVNSDSGLAYIDTGIIITDRNSEISGIVAFSYGGNTVNSSFLGLSPAVANSFSGRTINTTEGAFAFSSIFDGSFYNFYPIRPNIPISFTISPKNGYIECDGHISQMRLNLSTPLSRPLILFGQDYPYLYFKYYSFKAVVGNAIVIDLIPVSKDGVGYMYDLVSGKLFAAQGGGNFILGPRK